MYGVLYVRNRVKINVYLYYAVAAASSVQKYMLIVYAILFNGHKHAVFIHVIVRIPIAEVYIFYAKGSICVHYRYMVYIFAIAIRKSKFVISYRRKYSVEIMLVESETHFIIVLAA